MECKHCKSEFLPTNRKAKFCSQSCCDKARYYRIKADPILSAKRKASRPKWRRKSYRFKAYGITKEDYDRMFIEQGGKCKICQKHQSEFKEKLAIDHCHTKGTVRGLLCKKCNLGIGLFEDNPIFLQSAIKYLWN